HRATHGALPMFDDTQIDTLKLVETGQSVSRSVSFPYGIKNVLGTEDETLSPLKAASVQKSSESRCGSRGRIRTYDQSVNSRPLYHCATLELLFARMSGVELCARGSMRLVIWQLGPPSPKKIGCGGWI